MRSASPPAEQTDRRAVSEELPSPQLLLLKGKTADGQCKTSSLYMASIVFWLFLTCEGLGEGPRGGLPKHTRVTACLNLNHECILVVSEKYTLVQERKEVRHFRFSSL